MIEVVAITVGFFVITAVIAIFASASTVNVGNILHNVSLRSRGNHWSRYSSWDGICGDRNSNLVFSSLQQIFGRWDVKKMKFLQAYINRYGQIAVITQGKCLGRFTGCFSDCSVEKCVYKGRA